MKELAKQYDPSQVEDRIYQFWLDGGYFHTKADPDKKPYTIVMPPPNVTGQLHMGHAAILLFNDTGTALMLTIFALQDSFGTACNVTGDGALTLILTGYAEKHHVQ